MATGCIRSAFVPRPNATCWRDLKTYVDHIGLLNGSSTKVFSELTDALEWIEDEIIRLHKLDVQSTATLTLTDFDLFRDLTPEESRALGATAQTLTFKKGEMIYRQGTAGNCLLLIARGQIKLTLPIAQGPSSLHLLTLGRGQFFAEMSFVDGHPHSADAHALEDSELISIDREGLTRSVGEDHRMMLIIFKKLLMAVSARLRHSNAELQELRSG